MRFELSLHFSVTGNQDVNTLLLIFETEIDVLLIKVSESLPKYGDVE